MLFCGRTVETPQRHQRKVNIRPVTSGAFFFLFYRINYYFPLNVYNRTTAMNQRGFALFLGFYFYVLNVNAANDAQRVILLSSLIQIQALQAQLLLWNQRRRRRRGRRFPCFWVLPRPQQSWFDIHYFDATIPGDYFKRQLRLNRNTFSVLLNILRPCLTRQNRTCVTV